MKGDQERIKLAAEGIGKEAAASGGDKFKGITESMVKKGSVPKDLLGINDSMVEGIYGQAYRLYNTGKYRDAIQLFRLLIMLNATEPKYTMGLAASFHMLKEYLNAAETYTMCGMLDPENPIPHFHASDCYIQLNNAMGAIVALEMAVKRAGDKPHYATLKDRALMTIASLKKQLEESNEGLQKDMRASLRKGV